MEKLMIAGYDDAYNNFEDYLDGKKKGTILLAAPVVNINEWCTSGPSPYLTLLGLTREEMEKILYYAVIVVKEKDGTFSLVSEAEYQERKQEEEIEAYTGAEALGKMLESLTHDKLSSILSSARTTEQECMAALEKLDEEGAGEEETEEDEAFSDEEPAPTERDKIREKLGHARETLDAVWYFEKFGTSRLILDKIDVLPLQVRAILEKHRNTIPYSVLNDVSVLYARVAERNERVRKLTNLGAPAIIMRNEKRMLQEGVDNLINNGRRGRPATTPGGHVLTSLSDVILKSYNF